MQKQASPNLRDDWIVHIDESEVFFETKKGNRILRVRVHFRPKKEGNIVWYLETRTESGNSYIQYILTLEDMEKLGLLFLLLSKFCGNSMSMSGEAFAEIRNFKKVWEHLTQTTWSR